MKRRHALFVIPLLVCGAVALLHGHDKPATTQPAGEKVTTPSGLTIITTQKGSAAQKGDTVTLLYTGRLQDGRIFDASNLHGNEPIKVVLGAESVIKGWEEGLLGVQVGQKLTLIIPPDLAYGSAGRGQVIPPNATLEFDLEILSISRPQKESQ
jgi:peptidylprolyl isomerase